MPFTAKVRARLVQEGTMMIKQMMEETGRYSIYAEEYISEW